MSDWDDEGTWTSEEMPINAPDPDYPCVIRDESGQVVAWVSDPMNAFHIAQARTTWPETRKTLLQCIARGDQIEAELADLRARSQRDQAELQRIATAAAGADARVEAMKAAIDQNHEMLGRIQSAGPDDLRRTLLHAEQERDAAKDRLAVEEQSLDLLWDDRDRERRRADWWRARARSLSRRLKVLVAARAS